MYFDLASTCPGECSDTKRPLKHRNPIGVRDTPTKQPPCSDNVRFGHQPRLHDSGDFAPSGHRALGLLVSEVRDGCEKALMFHPKEEGDLASSRY